MDLSEPSVPQSPRRLVREHTFKLRSRTLSTFDAYMTACETMWGVIIFLRFGDLIMTGGLLLSLLVLALSATVQILNSFAVSAVATNGLHGGVYDLLVANLGPMWGATTTLLYYLGMSALATVEICGAVEAFDVLLASEAGRGWSGTLTRSAYYDTGLLGSAALLLLSLLRGFNSHAVHVIGVVVIVVFAITLGATLTGAVLQDYNESLANLKANWLPPKGVGSLRYADLSMMATFMYPCFAGIFQPANKAAELRNPYESVPVAAIGAVLTSSLVFSLILVAIASTAPPGQIGSDDFVLRTWPNKYVGLVGTMIVGVGSCVSCLDVAPTILQRIAADGAFPGMKSLGLHRLSGEHREPQRATAFTCVLAVPFAWLGGIEIVALAAAALFLQMYLTMDVCCLLLAALNSPGWRPHWPKITPLQAGSAAVLSVGMLLLLQVWVAPWLLMGSALLATIITLFSGKEEMGSGDVIAGLQYSIALSALHALREDPALATGIGLKLAPARWRPQILVLLPGSRSAAYDAQLRSESAALLNFAHCLKEGRGLVMVASVTPPVPHEAMRKTYAREKQRVEKFAAESDALVPFTDVVVAEEFGPAIGAALSTVGVGALRPNAVLLGWGSAARCDRVDEATTSRRALELLQAIRHARGLGKAVLLLCGAFEIGEEGFDVSPGPGARWQSQRHEYIDIHWLQDDGALPLILAHLLQMHHRYRHCALRVYLHTVSPPLRAAAPVW